MVLFADDICKHFITKSVGKNIEFRVLNKFKLDIEAIFLELFFKATTSALIKIILLSFFLNHLQDA